MKIEKRFIKHNCLDIAFVGLRAANHNDYRKGTMPVTIHGNGTLCNGKQYFVFITLNNKIHLFILCFYFLYYESFQKVVASRKMFLKLMFFGE